MNRMKKTNLVHPVNPVKKLHALCDLRGLFLKVSKESLLDSVLATQ